MLATVWYWQSAREAELVSIPCNDIVTGCGNQRLQIQFDQIPHVMQPFRLQIKADKALTINGIHASFTMKGMDMGLNRYRLLAQPDGTWLAKVTLPVCTQGRGNWLMTLEMDTATGMERYQLGFTSH